MMNKQLQVSFGLAAKKLVTFGLCAGLFGLSLPCGSYAAYGTELKLKSELDPAPVSEPAPDFIGFFDVGDCNLIAGWAADRNQPNTPIHVSIYDGPTLLTTVLANVSRPDVASTTGDNGLHGFNIPTPSILKNGLPHSVDVRFEATTTPLGTSPRSITCLTTPREDVGTGVLLAVDFKLNNGNASTSGRLVSLNFKATKVTGGTSEDITSQITHYRVRESDQQNAVADLSAQPWLPLEHALIMELALRNSVSGERYGDRSVLFQVKTATLTSNIVSDTITLEPVLKEYRVSAAPSLLKYASEQGFTFPLDYYGTCKGDCGNKIPDLSLASGTASIPDQAISTTEDNTVGCVLAITAAVITVGLAAPAAVLVCNQHNASTSAGTCVTKADYILFDGRRLNRFWKIKSVDVSGASVHFHGANSFRLKFSSSNSTGACNPSAAISIGDVVLEGPEADDFLDPANPWKDAFVRLRPGGKGRFLPRP